MNDLVAFLRARLDDDERAARRAGDSFRQIGETGVIVATEGDRAEECASANWAGIAEHIVRHDPARVIGEVEAKREVVDDYERVAYSLSVAGPGTPPHDLLTGATNLMLRTLRLLALPYAGQADYREEWRP